MSRSVRVFIAGLFLGGLLLVVRAAVMPILAHDDGISFLAATCHQGIYATDIPDQQWVMAAQWQSFWAPSQFLCFQDITLDLAHYDIHPPLYFWLLHIWVYGFGSSIIAAATLNICLTLLTAIAIYWCCRKVDCSPMASAGAALLWLLNPSTLQVSNAIRQYSLLGVTSVALLATLLVYLKSRSRSSLVAMYFVATAGLLTQYQFPILLVLAGVFVVIVNLQDRKKIVSASLPIFTCFAASVATFVIINPLFPESFAHLREQVGGFLLSEIMPRVLTTANAFLELALVPAVLGLYLLLLFLLLRSRSNRISVGQIGYRSLPAYLALTSTLGVVILYLLQFSPAHAMGTRYLSLISPLIFVAVGQMLQKGLRQAAFRRFFVFLFALLVVWISVDTTFYALLSRVHARVPDDAPLLVDSVARGVLPEVLWHLGADTPVYAASQSELIQHMPALNDLNDLIYVSDLRYGNTEAGRQVVLDRLATDGFEVSEEPTLVDGCCETYRLVRGK